MLEECDLARARGSKLRTKKTRTAYALEDKGLVRVERVFHCGANGCKIIAVDVQLTRKGRRVLG